VERVKPLQEEAYQKTNSLKVKIAQSESDLAGAL
jgi:hypothetical protein